MNTKERIEPIASGCKGVEETLIYRVASSMRDNDSPDTVLSPVKKMVMDHVQR